MNQDATMDDTTISRTTRDRVRRLLWKFVLVALMLDFLAVLTFLHDADLAQSLLFASGLNLALYAYLSLLRVEGSFYEFMRRPLVLEGSEFLLLGLGMLVIAFWC